MYVSAQDVTKLVIMRHGEFNPGESVLNAVGKVQVAAMARRLGIALASTQGIVVHSPGPLASETAELLAQGLDLPKSCFSDALWESDEPAPHKAVLQFFESMVSSFPQDAVILVTNGKFFSAFGRTLGLNVFTVCSESGKVPRGTAVMFDAYSGSVSLYETTPTTGLPISNFAGSIAC